MEVAVPMNDSQTLSPSSQQIHRRSRYSTPDTPNPRSPNHNDPSTNLPSASQEPSIPSILSPSHTQYSTQLPHILASMEAAGQNHDRMETDDLSEASGSGDESHQQDQSNDDQATIHTSDVEAMDTTPDTPEAGDVRLPSSPHHNGHEALDRQNPNDGEGGNRNLVRANSRGDTIHSRSPTPPSSNGPAPFISAVINPTTGQLVETVVPVAENWPPLFLPETQMLPNQPDVDAPAPQTPPPAEQERERIAGQDDDSPDEDSADEDEQPYWANFPADKSRPSEDELRVIEAQTGGEKSALDHEYWESLAFEALEDPEYTPLTIGRIEWTFKGYHGSPENPNKEAVMRSPSVAIGGYYWNIKLYPRGNENTEQMSVYVECSTTPREQESKVADKVEHNRSLGSESAGAPMAQTGESHPNSEPAAGASQSVAEGNDSVQPDDSTGGIAMSSTVSMKDAPESQPSWEVPAQVLCVAYNPEEPRVYAVQKVMHRYHRDTADWGWTRFTGPWERLHKRDKLQRRPLLEDDTLSLTAYIRTVRDDTKALWWHSPSTHLDWDNFERLGLNRLWVGSPESSAVVAAISTWVHIAPYCNSMSTSPSSNGSGRRALRDRPFYAELENVRTQLASPMKERGEAISLMNVAEMLDWNDAGNCEPDVVSNLDILRRTLSREASDVRPITEVRDIFEDVLLVRQSDYVIPGSTKSAVGIKSELSSVQETLDAASHYAVRDTTNSERPSVLQIELARQIYEADSRKWKKLTHRVSIDEHVTFKGYGLGGPEYTLFGIVVHSGHLESKDYYSIVRLGGPGTRWIKYAGDKVSRGVECLTTRQALEAHEGGATASKTAAVAYLVTYVRTDLLRSEIQSQSQETSRAQGVPESDDRVPAYIYQSSIFGNHHGLGIADWDLRERDDSRMLKIEVTRSMALGDLVDAIDEARKAASPGVNRKYALWLLDTVKGNRAMENVVRAPEIIPLSVRGPDSLLKDCLAFHGVCRIWLDDNTPIPPEPAISQTPSQIVPQVSDQTSPEDSMQIDEQDADIVPEPPATTEDAVPESAGVASEEAQAQEAANGDTLMEGNADPDALQGSASMPVKRVYNASLDSKALESFDNVFVFLKIFDAENQTLNGVKTMWVKQIDKVGYTVRQALGLAEDASIDVYQEQTMSTLEPVRPGSNYQDIAGVTTYILVVQQNLGPKENARLTAAGKPTTIPGFYSYQWTTTCDPAYLQSHLKTSYFASPYFSGSIAYGRPHGQGTLITTLGDCYSGNFVSGSKSGAGTMNFANGDTYTGSWANDDPDGQGEMVYAKTGNVYKGGFKKRKRHGKGVMHFEVADEEERLCGICFEEEMDCLFYDCGHVAACEGCARQVDICPVCRKSVKAVVRIWRS